MVIKRVKKGEIIFLLFLIHFGWAVGERDRLVLTNLNYVDFADYLISAFMMMGSFLLLLKIVLTLRPAPTLVPSGKHLLSLLFIVAFIFTLHILSNIIFYPGDALYDKNFHFHTLPIALLYFLFLYPYLIYTRILKEERSKPGEKELTLNFETPKGTLLIKEKDISAIYLSNGHCYFATDNQTHSFSNFSLSDLENMLDTTSFFKLNRQTIVARNVIRGFKPAGNQKIEVELSLNSTKEINRIVSKINASHFKAWLNQKN